MSSTADQRAAYEALREAIQRVMALPEEVDPSVTVDPAQSVVMDYAVVVSLSSFHLVEHGSTQYGYIFRNQHGETLPPQSCIGLLEEGREWLRG